MPAAGGHRRHKLVHGYKAHVATDQEAGLIRGIEVTTANVHDAAELEAVLPDTPGDVYGDSAFAGSRPEAIIRAHGGTPRVVHTGTWGGPEALARLQAHNAEVRRVRARIEKVSCAHGSRRYSVLPSTATACAGCAGSVWPRLACRSGSQPSLIICAGAGACSHPCRRKLSTDT